MNSPRWGLKPFSKNPLLSCFSSILSQQLHPSHCHLPWELLGLRFLHCWRTSGIPGSKTAPKGWAPKCFHRPCLTRIHSAQLLPTSFIFFLILFLPSNPYPPPSHIYPVIKLLYALLSNSSLNPSSGLEAPWGKIFSGNGVEIGKRSLTEAYSIPESFNPSRCFVTNCAFMPVHF